MRSPFLFFLVGFCAQLLAAALISSCPTSTPYYQLTAGWSYAINSSLGLLGQDSTACTVSNSDGSLASSVAFVVQPDGSFSFRSPVASNGVFRYTFDMTAGGGNDGRGDDGGDDGRNDDGRGDTTVASFVTIATNYACFPLLFMPNFVAWSINLTQTYDLTQTVSVHLTDTQEPDGFSGIFPVTIIDVNGDGQANVLDCGGSFVPHTVFGSGSGGYHYYWLQVVGESAGPLMMPAKVFLVESLASCNQLGVNNLTLW